MNFSYKQKLVNLDLSIDNATSSDRNISHTGGIDAGLYNTQYTGEQTVELVLSNRLLGDRIFSYLDWSMPM